MEIPTQTDLSLEPGLWAPSYGTSGWCPSPACMLYNIRDISSRAEAVAIARLGDGLLKARSPTNRTQVVTAGREPTAPALSPMASRQFGETGKRRWLRNRKFFSDFETHAGGRRRGFIPHSWRENQRKNPQKSKRKKQACEGAGRRWEELGRRVM